MTVAVLYGAAAMACMAIAVFFVRFWNDSRDRLFLCLAAGFWMLAANYGLLGLLPTTDARRPVAYLIRLLGLMTILIGILVKNRELTEFEDFDDDDAIRDV
jgi:hypothetical protein